MKKFSYRGLSVFICLYLGLCSSIGSYASTSSGAELDNGWTKEQKSDFINTEVFKTVLDCFTLILPGGASYADIQEDWRTLNATQAIENNLSYDDYLLQKCNLDIGSNGEVLQVTVDPQLLNNAQTVVNNYIAQNPLTYTECKIRTYEMCNVSWFPTYQLYVSFKEWASKQDGYILTTRSISGGNVNGIFARVIPKTNDINFVGTTVAGGFNNVRLYIGWSTSNSPWDLAQGTSLVKINNNGTIQTNVTNGDLCSSVGNTTNIYDGTTSRMTIWTNLPKDETVYVFNTLNALKAYNAGSPQPYYLGSGFNADKIWYSPQTITGGEVANHQNSYDYVINNVQTGWSAEQVIALVDKVMTKSGGSGSSDSDKDTSKWWERIGNAIGNLIDGIVDVLTKVIEKLSDALLSIIHLLTGYTDDSGTYHAGLFDKLTDLVDSGFSSFISSMFSWLPEEIVTLLTATLVFGIFFGIFKMLRR